MKLLKKIKSLFALNDENIQSPDVADKPAETGLHLQNDTISEIIKGFRQIRLVGKDIKGFKLWVSPKTDIDHLAYEHVLKSEDFKIELQRILDNNFIQLSENWLFEWAIQESLPEECTQLNSVLAISIMDRRNLKHKEATLKALAGKTWKEKYELKPEAKIIHIGRGKRPTLDSGTFQTNEIAFIDPAEKKLDDKTKEINLHVGRSHCYIKYDMNDMKYCLYLADSILNTNYDTKILRGAGNQVSKIDVNNERNPYPLEDGDQIQFNKKAVLEFKFKS